MMNYVHCVMINDGGGWLYSEIDEMQAILKHYLWIGELRLIVWLEMNDGCDDSKMKNDDGPIVSKSVH